MNKFLYWTVIFIELLIINCLKVKIYNETQTSHGLHFNQKVNRNHEIASAKVRQIKFSNYTWDIRANKTIKQNANDNFFTDSPLNVYIDKNGYLNMKITKVNNNWMCTEIYLQKSLGYGSYIFSVQKGFQNLDPLTVFGLFVWQDDTHQIDIQISKWGNSWSNSTQYAIQPFSIKGNLQRFSPQQTNISVVHVFTWTSSAILFQTFSATNINQVKKQIGKKSNSVNIIHQWVYAGNNNPKPGKQKLYILLKLNQGKAPSNGKQQQVVLKQFQFIPLNQNLNAYNILLALSTLYIVILH